MTRPFKVAMVSGGVFIAILIAGALAAYLHVFGRRVRPPVAAVTEPCTPDLNATVPAASEVVRIVDEKGRELCPPFQVGQDKRVIVRLQRGN